MLKTYIYVFVYCTIITILILFNHGTYKKLQQQKKLMKNMYIILFYNNREINANYLSRNHFVSKELLILVIDMICHSVRR